MNIFIIPFLLLSYSQNNINRNFQNNNDLCMIKYLENHTQVDNSAREVTIYEHGFKMNDYFSHLSRYSSYNIKGSCGYVSLLQLLSYVDTFVNDDIILEVYEKQNTESVTFNETKKQSPGLISFDIKNNQSIYDFANKHYKEDFQAYLIKKMNEIKNIKPSNWSSNISVSSYEQLIRNAIPNLNAEFTFKRSYGDSDKHAFMKPEKQKEYYNIIKSQILIGNPVIVHVAKNYINNKYVDYHSVIAYDFDDMNIYANYGWGSGYERRPLSYEGYYVADYGYFDLTQIKHIHSNNYIVKNHGFCGCNKHDYLFSPTWIDLKYHTMSCHCGGVKNMPHIISSSSKAIMPTRRKCSICGGNVETGLIIGPNKSYIDDSGVIVLNDEDMKLLNNIFYNYNGDCYAEK